MADQSSDRVPTIMRPVFETIVGLTDAFSKAHLDDEYAELCRRMAAALSRKRPSPLERGDPKTWASAIVYAVGSVNFLFDKTQSPHMTAAELAGLFGVSRSTCSARARSILESMKIVQADPRWYRPSRLDDNPFVWMLEIDGLIQDIRDLPLEVQEEALRRGLIPCIPKPRRL